jgi:polyhydroxyalkanoate synthase
MSTHEHDAPYVDPDTWQAETRVREGSWWPAWEHWLTRLAGPWVPPPPQGRNVRDAPGHYVLEP